jgi:hypothetical protein
MTLAPLEILRFEPGEVQIYLFTENDIIDRPEVDYAALMAWMVNYCKAHPLDTVQVAAFKLVRELEAKAAKRSE